MLLITLVTLSPKTQAQTSCKISPAFVLDSINPFFILKFNNLTDTFFWAKVTLDSNETFIYKVERQIGDEVKYRLTEVLQTAKYYSPLLAYQNSKSCVVKLIEYNDSINFCSHIVAFQYLLNKQSPKNENRKWNKVAVSNFETTVSTSVYSGSFVGQERGLNYTSVDLRGDIRIGVVPLKLGISYSSDNPNLLFNNLLSLSFDKELFETNLNKKIDSINRLSNKSSLADYSTLDGELIELKSQKIKLEHDLAQDTLSRAYKKVKRIRFEIGDSTKFTDSIDYQKVISFENSIAQKQKKIQLLQDSISNVQKTKDKLIRDLAILNERDSPRIRNINSKGKALSKVQRLIRGIEIFEIGSFTPRFSSVVTNGVSLNGASVLLHPSSIIIGGFIGYTCTNQGAFIYDKSLKQEFVRGEVVGLGGRDKNLTLLMVQSSFSSQLLDEKQPGFGRKTGTSIINLTYKYSIQKFTSEFSFANSAPNTSESIVNIHKNITGYKNNAYSGICNFMLTDINAKIKAEARWIDPYYYSPLAFYLRPDNVRLQLKWEQTLLKKRVSYAITSKWERDNLYGLKSVEVASNQRGINSNIKVSKKVTFIFSVSNSDVNVLNRINQLTTKFNFNSVTIGSNYMVSQKTHRVNTYSYMSFAGGSVSDSTLSFGKQYSIGNQTTVYFTSYGLGLNVNVMHQRYSNSDSLTLLNNIGGGASKVVFKHISLKVDYNFSFSESFETRQIWSSGVQCNFSQKLTIILSYRSHMIDKFKDRTKETNYLFNLQLRKFF